MNQIAKRSACLPILSGIAVLTGCGGGGATASMPPPPPAPTAVAQEVAVCIADGCTVQVTPCATSDTAIPQYRNTGSF